MIRPPSLPDDTTQIIRLYLAMFAFFVPSLLLAMFQRFALDPRLDQMWECALPFIKMRGTPHPLEIMRSFTQWGWLAFPLVMLILVALECSWKGWHRFRRKGIVLASWLLTHVVGAILLVTIIVAEIVGPYAALHNPALAPPGLLQKKAEEPSR